MNLRQITALIHENFQEQVLGIPVRSNALFRQNGECYTEKTMKIFFRIPKGWSKPTENKGANTCDIDGAKLWIGPGNQIYCDSEHDPKDVSVLQKRAEK